MCSFHKLILLSFIVIVWPSDAAAQEYFPELSIEVRQDGSVIPNAFAGGFTAPQFNKMDVDFDGDQDLVVFDRYNDRLFVFLWNESAYTYSPRHAALFPADLDNWMLLRDFNNDGRKDLFASTPLGMELYVNTGNAENGLNWRKYHDRSPGPSPILTQGFSSVINLQLNATDIPAIDDIDDDGDLDILVFRFAGGSTVEWHRNYAMEQTASADSLVLERVTSAWGGFRECFCGTFAFDNAECPPVSGRPMHEGGKTLTTIDLDGDGDRDALVSEETCDNLFFLRNDGTAADARFTTVLPDYVEGIQPFFPAGYYEDIDADGRNDLVMGSNWPSVREMTIEKVNFYRNIQTGPAMEFQLAEDRFMINGMIDQGTLSHPAFYDIDGDGMRDLVIGSFKNEKLNDTPSRLQLFLNKGTDQQPSFEENTDDFLSLSSQQFMEIRPYFTDLDGDGLSDLCFTAIKEGLGKRLYMIRGSGQAGDPFPGNPLMVFSGLGEQDVVSLFDANEDGVTDLLVGRVSGLVELYLGSGSSFPSFEFERSGIYDLGTDSFRGATLLISIDVDGDSVEDILRADSRGGMAWLPSGDASSQWQEITLFTDAGKNGIHNPGRNLAPVAVDLLGLSRMQLVVGSGSGGIQLLRPVDAVVSPPEDERTLVLYPNPNIGRDFIFARSSDSARFRITDLAGRLVQSFESVEPGQRLAVSTHDFSAGIYILTAIYSDGNRISKKFIVLR